jgi:hypothetical protein
MNAILTKVKSDATYHPPMVTTNNNRQVHLQSSGRPNNYQQLSQFQMCDIKNAKCKLNKETINERLQENKQLKVFSNY